VSGGQQYMVGELLGHFFFYAAVIGIGVGIGALLKPRNVNKTFVWWPVIVAALLVAFSLIGTLTQRTPVSSGEAGAAVIDQALHTEIIREKLPPGAQFNTDDKSLRTLADRTKNYVAQEIKTPVTEFSVDVRLLESNRGGIVLERTSHLGKLINSELLMHRDDILIGVNCTSKTMSVEPKFKGTVCGAEATKVLGVDLATVAGDL